jgi:hypothetical protein
MGINNLFNISNFSLELISLQMDWIKVKKEFKENVISDIEYAKALDCKR